MQARQTDASLTQSGHPLGQKKTMGFISSLSAAREFAISSATMPLSCPRLLFR